VRPVLLYDGACRLCRFAARTVVRLDRDGLVGVLPFADPAAAGLLASIDPAARLTSWHLVLPDGRHASRGEVAPLLELLPATRRLAPVARRLPLERLYALVSSRRGVLGRLVPDGPAPRRAP
jgi:predicted DCC family thiol-disulfide oxidoreductase YuxK